MVIDLRDLANQKKLYHSLYADVFSKGGRVFKLFKRSIDPRLDERSRTLFHAQCDAYARAARDATMRRHTARFHGTCPVRDVISEEGHSTAASYYRHACYVLEELQGQELKVTAPEILDNCPYIFDIRRRFENFGIDTTDASVFSYEDRSAFKLIDITTLYLDDRALPHQFTPDASGKVIRPGD